MELPPFPVPANRPIVLYTAPTHRLHWTAYAEMFQCRMQDIQLYGTFGLRCLGLTSIRLLEDMAAHGAETTTAFLTQCLWVLELHQWYYYTELEDSADAALITNIWLHACWEIPVGVISGRDGRLEDAQMTICSLVCNNKHRLIRVLSHLMGVLHSFADTAGESILTWNDAQMWNFQHNPEQL